MYNSIHCTPSNQAQSKRDKITKNPSVQYSSLGKITMMVLVPALLRYVPVCNITLSITELVMKSAINTLKPIITKQNPKKKNQIFLSNQITWCKYNFSQIPDFTINFTHIFFFLFPFLVYTHTQKKKKLHLCLKNHNYATNNPDYNSIKH